MSDTLGKILLKKYQEKTLASLYLINYDSQTLDPEIWVDNFLKELTPLADHPDILKVRKDPKENEYKVDSRAIKDFLKFINYRPLKLQKKFIFLFDAGDLSVIVSNKLLKVFEELGSDYCLMLLAPDSTQMLQTVLSRAVKLKIASPGPSTLTESDFSFLKTPQDLIAYLKEDRQENAFLEKKFIEYAIKQCLAQSTSTPESYKLLEEFIKILKDYEIAGAFNNSKLSRLSSFFP